MTADIPENNCRKPVRSKTHNDATVSKELIEIHLREAIAIAHELSDPTLQYLLEMPLIQLMEQNALSEQLRQNKRS